MSVRKISTASILSPAYKNSKVWDGTTFPGYFESIATAVVDSNGASNIEFTNIPQNYTHLQIRCTARSDAATGFSWSYLTLNSDTGTNYATHYLRGDGASATSAAQTGAGSNTEMRLGEFPRADATSGIFGSLMIDILDYTNTNKYKVARAIGGVDKNGSGRIVYASGLWQNTNAITTIKLTPQTDNWIQYSQFALYGIRGA